MKQPNVELPDPATDFLYLCNDDAPFNHDDGSGIGPVEGRIYWPEDCFGGGFGPPDLHPLVVLAHGDGHHYDDYDYLLEHLSRNGFIVATVSMNDNSSNVARAQRIRSALDYARNAWFHSNHVENNVALIGHSRGGEAVLTAARKIKTDWGLDHEINAIISLAPTDSDENGMEGKESLSGSHCDSLMVIYGSMDEDVFGYCVYGSDLTCGGALLGPPSSGFGLYDRAGSEGSTEFFASGPPVVDKVMFFIDRADHNAWRDTCMGGVLMPGFDPPLNCATHHELARGYMNGFLRWKLYGDTLYAPYFTNNWVLPTVTDQGLTVRRQYSPGSGRRVIDNFENMNWSDGTLATVSKSNQVTVMTEGPLFGYFNHTIPHDTSALVLRWSTLPILFDPWIRWEIDDGGPIFGNWNDLTGFKYLSFRVGQIYDASNNTPGQPQNFSVQLRDVYGASSAKVDVSGYIDLAYPHETTFETAQGATVSTPKSTMETVRIPLKAFQGLDKSALRYVYLHFGDDDHLQGEILLDSLEFTR